MSDERFWVGRYAQRVLLFDRSIQFEACPDVFLWNVENKSMGQYVALRFRELVRPAGADVDRDAIVASYEIWLARDGDAWLAEKRKYYAGRPAEEVARAEREAQSLSERLAARKRPYPGTHAPDEKATHRIAVCWRCKVALNGQRDLICDTCNWLKCDCGACGCSAE